MPAIVAPWQEALSQANLARAKSVVIVTDDEMLNLEVALLARTINPHIHLVVRTFGRVRSKVVGVDQNRRGEGRRGDAVSSDFPRVPVSPYLRVSLNRQPTGFDHTRFAPVP